MRLIQKFDRFIPTRGVRPVAYERVALVPAKGFTPSVEEVDQLAGLLAAAPARLGEEGQGLDGRALLQVDLHPDDGRVVTFWHAAPAVGELPLQVWPQRLLVVDEDVLADADMELGSHRVAAELTLPAGPSAAAAVDTDPGRLLGAVAEVFSRLDPARHEYAIVQVGLLPLSGREAQQTSRRLRGRAHRYKADLVAAEPHTLWGAQVWVAAWSDDLRRARTLRGRLVTMVAGHWSGPAGRWEPVADSGDPELDAERWQACMGEAVWAPAEPLALTTAEVACWLTPPAHDATDRLLRARDLPADLVDMAMAEMAGEDSDPDDPEDDPGPDGRGGHSPTADPDIDGADSDPAAGDGEAEGEGMAAVAPAPSDLPRYTGAADVLPLGDIDTSTGSALVGAPAREQVFIFTGGQSGYGKTTQALGRFLHQVVRADWRGRPLGGMLLDPHEDAHQAAKAHLAAADADDRVLEVLLTADRQPGWNLLAIADRNERPNQAGAIVDAIAAAQNWSDTQAANLKATLNYAACTLMDVALAVRKAGYPELTPTIFQIPTLLADEAWRDLAMQFTDARAQRHWRTSFDRSRLYSITNPISRLQDRPAVAALLGNPESTYDIRAAMDTGDIMLVCPMIPGADESLQKTLANLFTLDLLRAGLSRRDIPNAANRRPFWVLMDEMHNYDRSGVPRRMLSELRKFGVRGELLTQFPGLLAADTWRAIGTNASTIITTSVEDAQTFANRWRGISPQTITELSPHQFLAHTTVNEHKTRPFGFRSVPVETLFGQPAGADRVAELDARIDARMHRRRVDDVVAELNGEPGLESLDDRLGRWMREHLPREHAGTIHDHDRRTEHAPPPRPEASPTPAHAPAPPGRARELDVYRERRSLRERA